MNLLKRRRLTLVLGEQIQNSNVMNNFGFECRNKSATPKRPKSWTNDYSLLWCGVGVGYCFKPAFLTQQQVKQNKIQIDTNTKMQIQKKQNKIQKDTNTNTNETIDIYFCRSVA